MNLKDNLDEIIYEVKKYKMKPKRSFAETVFWLSAICFFLLSILCLGVSIYLWH